jgi:flagellar biosynthesis/type III secretory pathway protein FliH
MARKKSFKTTIPWELQIALIKLQGRMESTYDEACIKASQILDPNSEEFEKAVTKEVNKIKKSQVMSKVNKNKKTWSKKGYERGFSEGHRQGYKKGEADYKISYNCSVCGREIIMSPGEGDHLAMKKLMKEAGWAHSRCLNARKKKQSR